MAKFALKWGILATGGIAETFTKDLTCDPETRGVKYIEHQIVAAASSSSDARAKHFLQAVGAPSAKAYGSYQELVKDPNVDIIYIATPHSHHYQHARLCLEAGKNVLCEKPFTTNAAQLRVLIAIAREKNLFLMEAVWTRYFPLSAYVRDAIVSKRIGDVHRVSADMAPNMNPERDFDDTHRMVNPDLAGGALLDLGIYSLTWVFQCLYTAQPPQQRRPPRVHGVLDKYHTGVDVSASVLLAFPRNEGGEVHGIATASMRTSSDPDKKGTVGPAVRIFGDAGEMQVFGSPCRPTRTRIVLTNGSIEDKDWEIPGPGKGSNWWNGQGDDKHAEGEGHGMFWEADEAAFAIREGRKEGRHESLDESVVVMEVMDEVRRQNNMVYPDKIETTNYPVGL